MAQKQRAAFARRLGLSVLPFSGRGRITRDDASHMGQIEGTGADKNSNSRVKVNVTYSTAASDEDRTTITDVVSKVTVTGSTA